MLWELLVTDGHVRAARLRRAQPWVIALGLILLWAGIWVVHAGPEIRSTASLPQLLQERLAQAQLVATAPFSQLQSLQVSPAELQRLPDAAELPELIETLRKSLQNQGRPPSTEIDVTELEPAAFFAGRWEPEHVVYVNSGHTYLFGAMIHRGSATSPQPARWIGVMKRLDGQWQYATVAAGNSIGPANLPSVAPGAIPLTLQPLVPPLPRATHP